MDGLHLLSFVSMLRAVEVLMLPTPTISLTGVPLSPTVLAATTSLGGPRPPPLALAAAAARAAAALFSSLRFLRCSFKVLIACFLRLVTSESTSSNIFNMISRAIFRFTRRRLDADVLPLLDFREEELTFSEDSEELRFVALLFLLCNKNFEFLLRDERDFVSTFSQVSLSCTASSVPAMPDVGEALVSVDIFSTITHVAPVPSTRCKVMAGAVVLVLGVVSTAAGEDDTFVEASFSLRAASVGAITATSFSLLGGLEVGVLSLSAEFVALLFRFFFFFFFFFDLAGDDGCLPELATAFSNWFNSNSTSGSGVNGGGELLAVAGSLLFFIKLPRVSST
mmetsp:Transcript_63746/g.75427  ORF Transcript_63746/g.75427 Transcript_63746/m.75427 type:complete len:338 (+) Transcript_63746:2441-3454(+)